MLNPDSSAGSETPSVPAQGSAGTNSVSDNFTRGDQDSLLGWEWFQWFPNDHYIETAVKSQCIPAPDTVHAAPGSRLVWDDIASRWLPESERNALRAERRAHGMTWEEWLASSYPERPAARQEELNREVNRRIDEALKNGWATWGWGWDPLPGYAAKTSWRLPTRSGRTVQFYGGLDELWGSDIPEVGQTIGVNFSHSGGNMKSLHLYEVKVGWAGVVYTLAASHFGEAHRLAVKKIVDAGEVPQDQHRIISIREIGDVEVSE